MKIISVSRNYRRHFKYFIVFILGVISGIYLYPIMRRNRLASPGSHIFNRLSSQVADHNSRMVFVGGHPRSGTTLMRVLLDTHPDFNCNQETHLIPSLLTLRAKYSRNGPLHRITQAGLDLGLINATIAESILTILKHRNPNASRLCSKDPYTLKHIPYLSLMFPNAQFVLMVRDVRAVLHSIQTNKVKITNFPKTNLERFQRWSATVQTMFNGCQRIGPERCIVVHYESLVTQPRFWMENVLAFLGSDWNESVLKHTQYFNKSGGIAVSSLEKSSDQVRQPIHQKSLLPWLSSTLNISGEQLITLAPMMKILGYTEIGHPPKYSKIKPIFYKRWGRPLF